MNIYSNGFELNIQTHMRRSENDLLKASEKLTSGKRINQAGDDSAGLSIATRMTSQIRGKEQALKNVTDGISLLQTAESGAKSISDIMQRMRELAIQSSNGTLSVLDRKNLDREFQQLKKEIQHISYSNNFNGVNIIGSQGLTGIDPAVITDLKAKIPYWIDDAITEIRNNLGMSYVTNRDIEIRLYADPTDERKGYLYNSGTQKMGLNLSNLLDSNGQIYPGSSGGEFDSVIAHQIFRGMTFDVWTNAYSVGLPISFQEGLGVAVRGGNNYMNSLSPNSDAQFRNLISFAGGSRSDEDYAYGFATVKVLHEITVGGIQAIIDRLEAGDTFDQALANTTQQNQGEFASGVINLTNNTEFTNWFNTTPEVANYLNTSSDFTSGEGAILTGAGNSDTSDQESTITNNSTIENPGVYNISFVEDFPPPMSIEPINIHKDYNFNDTMSIEKHDLSTKGLNINTLNIENIVNAENTLGALDTALENVSKARVEFGSIINRLEHVSNNLSESTSEPPPPNRRFGRGFDYPKYSLNNARFFR